jgi:hypothetical protein
MATAWVEQMTDDDAVEMVVEWVKYKAPVSFDTKFVYSIEEALDEYGSLTTRQRIAINRIIDRWHIK